MLTLVPRSLCAALVLLTGVPALSATTPPGMQEACRALEHRAIPGLDALIEHAAVVPSGPAPSIPFHAPIQVTLPAYCRADGVIDRRTGHDGKPYAIRFAIALPGQWNGRYLMRGGGGLNGILVPPIGEVAAGASPALARGFAVISTDGGHASEAAFDAGFLDDQEATLNFLYAAVGKVAQAGKWIVQTYYARNIAHSYFVGCSTGGREAMLMTQRYPRLFDGVVAGAPAMRTSFSRIGDNWVTIALNQAAPRDKRGRPQAWLAFSDADRKLVLDALLKSCDARDGLADGIIADPGGCRFDPAALLCPAQKTDACLSGDQVAALEKGFAGPRDSRGVQVYPGFWFDTGIVAEGPIPGLLHPSPTPIFGPVYLTDMDVDREEIDAATANAGVGDTAQWTELNTFSGNGGKVIFYHGVSDPWFSAQDTVRYFERLGVDNGGASAASHWASLFLVPGMGHCGGGPAALDQFDLLDPIVEWVEKGAAPQSVIATGPAFPRRSRPLCPWPRHAHYLGSGDSERAESFECRNP